jgi:hypothetical protein
MNSLKRLGAAKRKSGQAFGGDAPGSGAMDVSSSGDKDEDEAADREFLAADQQILARLRADEVSANLRSTVLNAANTVCVYVCVLYLCLVWSNE